MDLKINPASAAPLNQVKPVSKPVCNCGCCADKSIELAPKEPFFQRVKNGVKNAWNFCINTSEMTKGAISGVANGIVAGAGIMSFDWLLTSAAKVSKKEIKLTEMLKQPFQLIGRMVTNVASKISKLHTKSLKDFALYIVKIPKKTYTSIAEAKNVSKIGKIAAPIVGLAVLGATLLNAKLRANKKTADVDHKLKTGHREV